MKNKIILSIILATLSIQASAEYIIKYHVEPSPNSITIKGWFNTSALISDWLNTGVPFDCGSFSPLENTITIGQSFEQSRNCSINQERTIQNRKISENGTYKNEGEPTIETIVSSLIESNNAIGTKTYDETPYNLTDKNWINGVSIPLAGFFLDNNQWNVDRYHVGDSIKFIDGQIREITRIDLYPPYMNIYLNGTPLDGNIVGYPNKIILQ